MYQLQVNFVQVNFVFQDSSKHVFEGWLLFYALFLFMLQFPKTHHLAHIIVRVDRI